MRTLCILICGVLSSAALAEDSDYAITDKVESKQGSVVIDESEVHSLWGFSEEEWGRYQLLKQGPIGNLNPNMSPLLVMAMGSRNDAEMNEYLERFIQIRIDLTERTLAISKRYPEIFFSNYDKPPIQPEAMALPEENVRPGDRFVLIVDSGCLQCKPGVRAALQRTKVLPRNKLDIYVQEARSDQDIIEWAKEVVEMTDLEKGRVTLNPHSPHLTSFITEKQPARLLISRDDKLVANPELDLFLK